MAWTASVVSVTADPTPGIAVVHLRFTDGTATVNRTERVSEKSEIERIARRHLELLQRRTEINQEIANPTTGPIAVPPAPPTQAEIDRNAWLADYTLWVRIKTTLIDTGILTGTEPALTTLKTRVQANFRAAYINFI